MACATCNKNRGTNRVPSTYRNQRTTLARAQKVCKHTMDDLTLLKSRATKLADIITINSAINTFKANCQLYEQTVIELKQRLTP